MGFYTIFDILQGLILEKPEHTEILRRNQIWFVPMVNPDGCYVIWEHYMQTGELLLKRKNNNRSNEGNENCEKRLQGVDINRNYGFLWGNNDGVCGEGYAGPYPFSEPETRAMRELLTKHQETIKFVYNFHSYGPMYIWPYNAQ